MPIVFKYLLIDFVHVCLSRKNKGVEVCVCVGGGGGGGYWKLLP